MKRAFSLLLISVVLLSFTTTKSPEKPTNLEVTHCETICLNNAEVEITMLDGQAFYLAIVWTGDAEYNGSMNWDQIRIDIRTFYEGPNWGKGPLAAIIDNNHEVWVFNGVTAKGSVEASMSKNGNVDPDDGD